MRAAPGGGGSLGGVGRRGLEGSVVKGTPSEGETKLPPLPPVDERLDASRPPTVVPLPESSRQFQVVDRRTVWTVDRRLVDFAVVLQVRRVGDDTWVEVLKVDTAHRTVHVHILGDRHTETVPSDCRTSIERAHRWVLGYVWNYAIEEL